MARTIVVTGASRGIGRRLTQVLAERGHRVFAASRRPGTTGDDGSRVEAMQLDTTDPGSCRALASALRERVDQIDVLVNNAGIKSAPGRRWEASAGPLPLVEPSAVADIFATNVIGTLNVTQAMSPLMRHGSVVLNVSSQLGSLADGVDVDYAYNASKAALNMVTVTMQRDLGERGISAVALNPGWIRTEMGGDDAPLDLDDAVADIADLVGRVDSSYGGRFVDRLGEPMRW